MISKKQDEFEQKLKENFDLLNENIADISKQVRPSYVTSSSQPQTSAVHHRLKQDFIAIFVGKDTEDAQFWPVDYSR